MNTIKEVRYSAGHNFCWFWIECENIIAKFRLHMEEAQCWNFFKLQDPSKLFPCENSSLTFCYGQKERRPNYDLKDEMKCTRENLPEPFEWFDNYFETNCPSQWGGGWENIGVKFYEI